MGKGSGNSSCRPSLSLMTNSQESSKSKFQPSEGYLILPNQKQREEFYVNNVEDNKYLIMPTPAKFSYKPSERWWRSALVDDEGRIISMGYPKFGNLGETGFLDHKTIFLKEMRNNSMTFTEKLDGSLAIRYVEDGKVKFRTRGSIKNKPFQDAIENVARKKYPVLLDPEFCPSDSLLFEFVSPQFKVVIRYPQDDLVMIGGVRHKDLQIWTPGQVDKISQDNKLHGVKTITLPSDPDQTVEIITKWDDSEGVVAKSSDGQTLVKIKAEKYLQLHRLRSNMSFKNVQQSIQANKLQSEQEVEKFLKDQGADWEIISDVKPFVQDYFNAKTETQNLVEDLYEQVDIAKDQYKNKKDFSLDFVSRLPQDQRSLAFLLWDEKKTEAHEKAFDYKIKNLIKASKEPSLEEMDLN